MTILSQHGVEVMSPRARALYRKAGAEVDDASETVRMDDALVAAAKAFADGTRLAASIMDPITALAAMESCAVYFEDTLTNAMNGALDHAENVYHGAPWPTPKHPDAP